MYGREKMENASDRRWSPRLNRTASKSEGREDTRPKGKQCVHLFTFILIIKSFNLVNRVEFIVHCLSFLGLASNKQAFVFTVCSLTLLLFLM